MNVTLNKNIKVDSVTANTVNADTVKTGDVSISKDGINAGNKTITNVAAGVANTDAANVGQLNQVRDSLNSQIHDLRDHVDDIGDRAFAGVAGAIAQGSIPQVTRPGATGVGVGTGYYGGQSAVAIGVSSMSDGGNWVVKGNFSTNTQGRVGAGAGVLYQW